MTQRDHVAFESLRTAARAEAEALLAERGFSLVAGCWVGALDVGRPEGIPVRVSLPARFPDALPEVRLDRSALPRRIPHVEQDGKVCIAATTGLLLDAENPRGLVAESLARAARTVAAGLRGDLDRALTEEFLAYWQPTTSIRALSIVEPKGPARPVVEVRAHAGMLPYEVRQLIAESREAATAWLQRLGSAVESVSPAFYLPLGLEILPPEFGVHWKVRDALEDIRRAASSADRALLRSFLESHDLPLTLVVSIPVPSGSTPALIAIRFDAPTGDAGKVARRGFRPDRLRALNLIQRAPLQVVNHVRLDRFDPPFLLGRIGSTDGFRAASVAVVGCGSVGSFLAFHLAALGVSRLVLVDPETMESVNVHRHFLGTSSVGKKKVVALGADLSHRFPNTEVESIDVDAETFLATREVVGNESSMVVFATGDHTVELRLNELLVHQAPLAFCWVEPLGAAAHVLVRAKPNGRGCLRCLYERDPRFGLVNRSSLISPGQELERRFAGCSGAFTPFSGTDANRLAAEAAGAIGEVLRGDGENQLISIRSRAAPGAVELSSRARMLIPGQALSVHDFAQRECPVCG